MTLAFCFLHTDHLGHHKNGDIEDATIALNVSYLEEIAIIHH